MMTLNMAAAWQDDRQLSALIGLDLPAFETLLSAFIASLKAAQRHHDQSKPKQRRQRKPGGGRKSAIGSPEHQLVFLLFYLKNYPTYDVLAFTFNISRACAYRSVQRLLPVLKQALNHLHALPKRRSDPPEALLQLINSVDHILIDATERPMQRPQKPARQKNTLVERKVPIHSRIRSSPIPANAC